jgi:parallel beta-helix repeat protein
MQRAKLVLGPLISAAVALILFGALAVPASVAQPTVGAQGPFTTIQGAIDAARAGDTLFIGPGTYVENVVVNKPLTIMAASTRPTVQAADPSKDVFNVTSSGVRIEGLKVTGGASGVGIQGASKCVVTNIVALANQRAVYLGHSNNNEITRSNLAGNGYGVYSDYSSGNTISANNATGEKGAGNALGDGIYFNYGGSNKVTNNILSANHVYGISLYHSTQNVISNNTISDNENIGVRLGEASNNNTLTFNTISGNPQLGIMILSATGNQIYLNDFISQPAAVGGVSGAILNSPEKMVYTYGGVERTGIMSNYYSEYKGTDPNGSGIGTTPSAYGDRYPLVQPFANYGNIIAASAVTPTPSPPRSETATLGNQSSLERGLPGFEAAAAAAGLTIAGLVVLSRKNRSK